ncbi:phage portal protein [Micromonospora haikouensis]|uniref:phage portal protein n=1 Tax=Micromonospora haikouensis TaxID=686309 RepID=UPI00379AB1EC
MTALQALFERRSVQDPTVPLTADQLQEFVLGASSTDAGVPVTERSSMQMSAVWRCVSVTAGVAAALPLRVFEPDSKVRVPAPLLRRPNPEMTRLELWRLAYVHRLLWGNTYVQKLRNRGGQVTELWPVTPDRVQVERLRPGGPYRKRFWVTDDWGVTVPMTPREILHIPGLGFDGMTGASPIRNAMGAIGLARAAEKSGSRFFARGAQLSGVLQVEQRLEQGQAEALQRRWEARTGGLENAHKVVVLDSNAKFAPITMPLKDAQFLETRQFAVPEIARFFGVPLFLLFETQKSTSWGTGLEQQAQGWITFDLHPTWLAPTEQRVEMELFGEPGQAERDVRYNVNGLLRGDSPARAAFYNVMRQVGAFSANDILDLEDRPPVPGGDVRLQPLNMVPLGTEPDPEPAPAPEPVPDDEDDDEGADDDEE